MILTETVLSDYKGLQSQVLSASYSLTLYYLPFPKYFTGLKLVQDKY